MDLDAIRQRPFVRIEAAIERQQGRVDIDHPADPLGSQPGRQNAHEAGAGDNVDIAREHRLMQNSLKGFAARKISVVDRNRFNTVRPRTVEPLCIGPIGDDQGDFRR